MNCPHCLRAHEVHNPFEEDYDGRAPSDGAVSICWQCRRLAVYQQTAFGLVLRQPTSEEEQRFARSPRIAAMQAAAVGAATVDDAIDEFHLIKREKMTS